MRLTAERKAQRHADDSRSKAFIRSVSRRGSNNTITFSNVEDMPDFLRYGSSDKESSGRSSSDGGKGTKQVSFLLQVFKYFAIFSFIIAFVYSFVLLLVYPRSIKTLPPDCPTLLSRLIES